MKIRSKQKSSNKASKRMRIGSRAKRRAGRYGYGRTKRQSQVFSQESGSLTHRPKRTLGTTPVDMQTAATYVKNLDSTAGEFIGAPLKRRAKRKTVSLERLSTELSGALRDRRCAWSKDLSPTQQGTDRPFQPSTKD